jgi:hypothetical protein
MSKSVTGAGGEPELRKRQRAVAASDQVRFVTMLAEDPDAIDERIAA